ncbi:MAG TPA: hypothetical protein VN673_15025 [Clostridia bacterium]|nr:hypothetical protein [Clostridia bacterium]
MFDYNNRQYGLMLEQIQQFEVKRIDLKQLINGLESLLCDFGASRPEMEGHFSKGLGCFGRSVCGRPRQRLQPVAGHASKACGEGGAQLDSATGK